MGRTYEARPAQIIRVVLLGCSRVCRFAPSWPSLRRSLAVGLAALSFLVLGQVGTHGSGHLAHVNLVADCGTCEVGVLRKRLLGVVAGAIQVGNKSADTEKAMQVCGFHR